jgi:hypothetical protein
VAGVDEEAALAVGADNAFGGGFVVPVDFDGEVFGEGIGVGGQEGGDQDVAGLALRGGEVVGGDGEFGDGDGGR